MTAPEPAPSLPSPASQQSHLLGAARIEPTDPVIAGELGTWIVTLTVGALGIDEGGTIKLAKRFASDWEAPQFDRPADSGYTTVQTNGAARLVPRYSTKGEVRPWMRAIIIDVLDGELRPGERVEITLGDRAGGGPGMRAQTFVETEHTFRVMVDPTNACTPRDVAQAPAVQVIAGKCASLVAVAPSQIWPGARGRLALRGEDHWNNPTGELTPESWRWEGTGEVTHWPDGSFVMKTAGVGRLQITAEGFATWSNPVLLLESEPAFKFWWGDLHAQSGSTIGTGSEEDYFTFARDQASLDFVGHQANDFQLTDENYRILEDAIERHHEDGSFVIIPGYEWSGNTSAGGDRNVFYDSLGHPLFRSSNWQIPADTKYEEAHPASELFRRLKQHGHAIVCSHVGGRYANIRDYYDEEVCRLVEVTSCCGVFEWLVADAIDKGYRFGIVANSDGHKGRPGAEGPGAGEFGIRGGLTCVRTGELTRSAVFAGLHGRCCYGTTGARMLLFFSLNGAEMGAEVNVEGEVTIQGSVYGCGPLEKVELLRGTAVEGTWQPKSFAECADSSHIRVSWKGARHRGRGRRVRWDGAIELHGNKLVSAETFAFDSRSDGITSQTDRGLQFRSSTTGDTDGIELTLEHPFAGNIALHTAEGTWEASLADLQQKCFALGSLEREVVFQRYPSASRECDLAFDFALDNAGRQASGAWYVKATQTDGQIAWSSPIFATSSRPPQQK